MNRIKQVYATMLFVLIASFGFAQKTITGKVTDAASGDPLIGSSVVIKGTTKGTLTDTEGGYSLSVPEGSTLVFSFVGYAATEIKVGGTTTIDVALSAGQELTNVVVVGSRNATRTKLETPVPVDRKSVV